MSEGRRYQRVAARRHVGDDKLTILEEIEEDIGDALSDEHWNTLAGMTRVELHTVLALLAKVLFPRSPGADDMRDDEEKP